MMKTFLKFALLIVVVAVFVFIQQRNEKAKDKKHEITKNEEVVSDIPDLEKQMEITYLLMPNEDESWGYEIRIAEKPYIMQTIIPGIKGKIGFKNKDDAEKVALLVVEKLENGEKLPSVSKEELKKMEIILND